MAEADYSALDEALDVLSGYGPDLANGLTSHAPMVVEALCAMGRPDSVFPWLERYRKGMLSRPSARERISTRDWRSALGRAERFADWSELFGEELKRAPWSRVLDEWLRRLAPGISASATHGVIRVGHAVRSLGESASTNRLRELADALASWASTYQELPTAPGGRPASVSDAIRKVPLVPADGRRFHGTITSSLEALGEFPDFATVIDFIDVSGPPDRLASELTEAFARVYLANAHDVLTAIVFIHGVTSIAAVAAMLPHLEDVVTASTALRFAWQASAALYAAFGTLPPAVDIEPRNESVDTLLDRAIAHGDEHAIKFTEACLRQHAFDRSPAYLAAVHGALGALPRVNG